MLKVWGRKNSINVQKVMWAIDEMGLPCQRIDVGGSYGGVDTEAYVALNPNRLVPTLEDEGFVLWESNAIVRYLAARHGAGNLWPTEARARAVADQWMDWQQTVLTPDMRTLFWELVRTAAEKRDRASIEAAATRLESIWARLDRHLHERAFVAGDTLSMGDIPAGAMCHRYYALDVDRPPLAHLGAWYERLKARPAFRAHVMIPLS